MGHVDNSYLRSDEGEPLVLEKTVKIQHSKKSLRIGVPKELLNDEHRVALTPDAIEVLVKSGIEVFIQEGAGEAAGYTDEAYRKGGAIICINAIDIFRCDVVVKVAFPEKLEVELMNGNSVVISSVYCFSPETIAAMKSLAKKKQQQ